MGKNDKFWKKDECWTLLHSSMATGSKPVYFADPFHQIKGFDLGTQKKMGIFPTAP